MPFANPNDFEVVPQKPTLADPKDFEVVASPAASSGPASTSPSDQAPPSAPVSEQIAAIPSTITGTLAQTGVETAAGAEFAQGEALDRANRQMRDSLQHDAERRAAHAQFKDHIFKKLSEWNDAHPDQKFDEVEEGKYGSGNEEAAAHKQNLQDQLTHFDQLNEGSQSTAAGKELSGDAAELGESKAPGKITSVFRGLTKGASMAAEAAIPGVGTGVMAAQGASAAYGQAKAAGKSEQEASDAGARTLLALAAFGGSNKIVSGTVAKLLGNAPALKTFLVQTLGQTAGNEATSRVIAAYEAASAAPPGQKIEAAKKAAAELSLESFAQNLGFGAMGGLHAAGEAAPSAANVPDFSAVSEADFPNVVKQFKSVPDTDPRKAALEKEIIRRDATGTTASAPTPPPAGSAPSETPQAQGGETVSQPQDGTAGSFRQAQKEASEALKASVTPEARELAPATAAATEKLADQIENTPPKAEVETPAPSEAQQPIAEKKAPAEAAVAPKESAPVETIPEQLYHASPHDFLEFSNEKFGTGEGGGSFGHGIYLAEHRETGNAYQKQFEKDTGRPAKIYTVKLKGAPEDFVDYGKLLSEQPQKIQDAAKEAEALPLADDYTFASTQWPKSTGRTLYGRLEAAAHNALVTKDNPYPSMEAKQKWASDWLKEHGIKGIKYLDQGSRSANKGTNNYVVFDAKDISTTHKNGEPISQQEQPGATEPPVNLTPAIKTEEGIKTGENHPEIIEREGLEPEVRDSKEAGFVDDKGDFKTREQAAEETGLPTSTEEGKLHSRDLPKQFPKLDAFEKSLEDEPAPKRAAEMTKEEKVARLEQELKDAPNRDKKGIRARIKALTEEPAESKPEPEPVEKPKEIWEKTREEVRVDGGSLARHSLEVKDALKRGVKVPLEVLEDFKGREWADKARQKLYGEEVSDTLLGRIAKALEDDPTKLYSDPLLIQTIGKPVLRQSVKVLRAGLEAGKLAKDAVEDAITYLRANAPNFTEDKVRTLLGNLVSEDEPKGGDSNERTEEKGKKEGVLTPPGEGETVPSQSPEPDDRIGIQNAVTDALRDKHGIGERDAIIKRTFPTVKAEADAAFTENQFVGKELVDELKKQTRPLTDREDAILTIELARRKNEYETSLSDGDSKEQKDALAKYLDIIPVAENVGTANARGLNARKMMINSDYTLAGIARRVYREKGRPLTPEEMESVAKDAKAVEDKEKEVPETRKAEESKAQDAETTAAYEKTIADLKKQLEAKTGKKAEPIEKRLTKPISERIIAAAKSARESALERIKARKGKLFADPIGVMSAIDLADHAIVGATHLIEGSVVFTKWSAKMVKDFGKEIKPHLRTIFDASKEQAKKMLAKPEKTPVQAKAAVKADATAGEALSHKAVYDLARAHINAGVHGEDAVMKAVHNDVNESYPEATERDVRRAFSEYGKVKFPSPDAVKKELREIRTLTRLQESIDREKAGLDALHSGLQRDKATQSIREKQKQLNELLKARQGPPSPEKLASRDQAKQTALRNAIADLDKQLRTGEKPTERAPTPDSRETQQLRAERDAMRDKLKEIEAEANPPKSPAEKQLEELGKRKQGMEDILSGKLAPAKPASKAMLSTAAEDIQAEIHAMQELAAQMKRDAKPESDPGAHSEQQQIKALEKSIERYREKTADKDFTTLGKKLGPDTVTVAQMKEIRDSRKAMYEAQEKLANPPKTPDEIYNERRMSQIAKRKAELDAQDAELTATRKITPKEKPAKKFLFPETARADAELTQLKKDIDNKIGKIKYEDRSAAHKAVDAVISAWRAVTAVTIAGHGTTGMGTHAGGVAFRPTEAKKYWTNFARQFGMWASKPFHDEAIFRLKNNPLYETAKSAGLAVDPDKTYTDYSMYAHWLENPPKVLGKPGKLAAAFIKSGERGFDALKLMRMEMFDGEYNRLSPELKADPETSKLLAEMTNKATGAIPKTSPIAPRGANALDTAQNQIYNMAKNLVSNAVLFAPRLLASRWMRATFDPVKTVYTFANWRSETPAQRQVAVRKAQHAAEFAATYVGALLVNQGLLAASGSKQNVNFTNPSDTDWLKFKAFDKVITADGGLLDPIRLIGQIVLGDLLHEMTPAEKFKNETKFKKVFGHLGQYARGKFNPTFGLIVDATTGTDFTGRPLPVDLPSVVAGRQQPKQTPKDAEFHPKYSWPEWIAQRGPIPLSGGTKVVYDQLRKSGRTHVEAKDIIEGAAATAFEMTGEKISEDNPRRLKSIR